MFQLKRWGSLNKTVSGTLFVSFRPREGVTTLHSSSLSFLLIRIFEKQSRAREWVGVQREIKSYAGLWQERQDLLWNRVIMRLMQIPWHSGSRLCQLCPPSGSGMGLGIEHTHSEWFRRLRWLSGMAVDLRLVLWCCKKNQKVCDLIGNTLAS